LKDEDKTGGRNMKTSRSNWVAAAVVAGLLIAGGAGRAWATDFEWNGNTSGNWSDPNNWTNASSYPQTGADNATLPAATAGRSITVDVAVVVNDLTWPASSTANTLLLNNDLTVEGAFAVGIANNTLNVNGHTLTISGNNNTQGNTPQFSGAGRIVKVGTDTMNLGIGWHVHAFSGELIVSNGVVAHHNNCGFLNFSTGGTCRTPRDARLKPGTTRGSVS